MSDSSPNASETKEGTHVNHDSNGVLQAKELKTTPSHASSSQNHPHGATFAQAESSLAFAKTISTPVESTFSNAADNALARAETANTNADATPSSHVPNVAPSSYDNNSSFNQYQEFLEFQRFQKMQEAMRAGATAQPTHPTVEASAPSLDDSYQQFLQFQAFQRMQAEAAKAAEASTSVSALASSVASSASPNNAVDANNSIQASDSSNMSASDSANMPASDIVNVDASACDNMPASDSDNAGANESDDTPASDDVNAEDVVEVNTSDESMDIERLLHRVEDVSNSLDVSQAVFMEDDSNTSYPISDIKKGLVQETISSPKTNDTHAFLSNESGDVASSSISSGHNESDKKADNKAGIHEYAISPSSHSYLAKEHNGKDESASYANVVLDSSTDAHFLSETMPSASSMSQNLSEIAELSRRILELSSKEGIENIGELSSVLLNAIREEQNKQEPKNDRNEDSVQDHATRLSVRPSEEERKNANKDVSALLQSDKTLDGRASFDENVAAYVNAASIDAVAGVDAGVASAGVSAAVEASDEVEDGGSDTEFLNSSYELLLDVYNEHSFLSHNDEVSLSRDCALQGVSKKQLENDLRWYEGVLKGGKWGYFPSMKSFFYKANLFLRFIVEERMLSKFTFISYRDVLKKTLVAIARLNAENKMSIASWDDIKKQEIRVLGRMLMVDQNNEPYSSATGAHTVYILSSFFRFLELRKLIAKSPMQYLSAPRVRHHLPRVLSNDEMDDLTKGYVYEFYDVRDRAIVELIYSSGLRVGEVVSLNEGDIDFDSREVRVVGKGSKERIVPMGRVALKALKRYQKMREEKGFSDRALFLNRRGSRISTRQVQLSVAAMAKKAGIAGKVSPHKIRHSFATEMVSHGADLRLVQEMLGHSSLAVTQIYTHMDSLKLGKTIKKSHPRAALSDEESTANEFVKIKVSKKRGKAKAQALKLDGETK